MQKPGFSTGLFNLGIVLSGLSWFLAGWIDDVVHQALDLLALRIGELIGGNPVLAERICDGAGDFRDAGAAWDQFLLIFAAVVIEIAACFVDVTDDVRFALHANSNQTRRITALAEDIGRQRGIVIAITGFAGYEYVMILNVIVELKFEIREKLGKAGWRQVWGLANLIHRNGVG